MIKQVKVYTISYRVKDGNIKSLVQTAKVMANNYESALRELKKELGFKTKKEGEKRVIMINDYSLTMQKRKMSNSVFMNNSQLIAEEEITEDTEDTEETEEIEDIE